MLAARWILVLGCAFVALRGAGAEDPFADVIRKTEPLTPDQEQKTFHLPPGFEAQLVASEPDIGKPMNMAFDARGRLWITQSREYPFPVLPVEKKGRDKILVLENFDKNGRAQKITTFVEGLNIPIGLYPYQDGVIAFTIPKIHFFRDTDGDGRADTDEVLLSGFGYQKDTHGLTSNFRRGFDGCIYADHGFNNDSTVVGRDGSTIKMNSGNCYRFFPDGTHVEQHSFGQVNPFGLMFDSLGDLWSADCHSSPTYVLLRGGYYPSFGKPNDGLGFAPNICTHSHGSTAIAGMVYYDDDQFPPEYRNNTFIGNVMTCRINRDSYEVHGSTRIAKEEPDFLSSDDPWFRPVMLEFGPDGAIYMADFYNRIIGHYEVPLNHPGRDRERGRIWRIVYKGNRNAPSSNFDISKASASSLITELASSNIRRRMLATDQLVDRIGRPAIKPLAQMMRNKDAVATQKAHGLWALSRLGGLTDEMLSAASHDLARLVRVHAMRILAETGHWSPTDGELARQGAADPDAFVQRAAAEALGRHPTPENLKALLRLRRAAPAEDQELVYVARMALRNQLLSDDVINSLTGLTEPDLRLVADVAVGAKTKAAAQFLLEHLSLAPQDHDQLESILRHVARYAPEEEMERLRDFTRERFSNDTDFQLDLFKSIKQGIDQRGATLSPALRGWAVDLAETSLVGTASDSDWRSLPFKGNESADPWILQNRRCADGENEHLLISSLPPGGERLTGVLRSKPFSIPPKLAFFIAGHDGPPGKPRHHANLVRLVGAHDVVLAEAEAPRKDVAQPVYWDLSKHAGEIGSLELVDGDDGEAYAWLAAGRFNPAVVSASGNLPNQVARRQEVAADLAAQLKMVKLEKPLETLLLDTRASIPARAAATKALMAVAPSNHLGEIGNVLADSAQPEKLREACAQTLAESGLPESRPLLVAALATAPQSLQTQIALALASHVEGAEALLDSVEGGKASRRLLQDKAIKDRLTAARPANLAARLDALTKGLPAEDTERQKLIDQRVAAFKPGDASASLGAAVFKQNCAVCHSIDGQGATVGPQLDGVGNRGAPRLVEDILDPSRNVDRAFRVTLFTMKDGDVQSGLLRREEGETVIIADGAGKEHSLQKSDIAERRESELSLMPDNFSQLIKPDDFNHLLAFLLSKGTKGPSAR
jgi:putative heme-binding domain-containing protein